MHALFKEMVKSKLNRYKRGVFCFNFHQVADSFDNKYHMPGTFTSTKKFWQYIDYLRKEFDLINVDSAINIQKEKKIDGRYACITFDDGDATIKNVIPMLVAENVPAAFFLNSAYLDNVSADCYRIFTYFNNSSLSAKLHPELVREFPLFRNTLDRNKYFSIKGSISALFDLIPEEDRRFYADSDFLRKIDSPLITIGLHGHEHDRFIMLDYQDQIESLSRNIRALGSLKGYRPIFAIPFGRPRDWNYSLIRACFALGLDFAMANGGVNIGDEVGLKRIPADNKNLILTIRLNYFQ